LSVGLSVGTLVGGTGVGMPVDAELGMPVGAELGMSIGIDVGMPAGIDVRADVGVYVGADVGAADGAATGAADGAADGAAYIVPIGAAMARILHKPVPPGPTDAALIKFIWCLHSTGRIAREYSHLFCARPRTAQ
jgi:hypothetical protein